MVERSEETVLWGQTSKENSESFGKTETWPETALRFQSVLLRCLESCVFIFGVSLLVAPLQDVDCFSPQIK